MNVASLLAASAERFPDKPALVFQGRRTTYGQLQDTVERAAGALVSAGAGPGERVGMLLGNVPEFVYTLYGAFRAGAVAVPMNVMLTGEEIAHILADSGAKVVVTQMGYLPAVLSVRDRLPDLESVLVVAGPPVPPGTISFEEALNRPAGELPPESGDDDLALLQYTSGTTARPKGAMLTHSNLIANLEQVDSVEAMRIREDDVVMVVLPAFHIYALNVVLGATLRAGATAVLVERFEPAETLRLVRDHGVTVLPGAPPMYVSWLATDEEEAPADSFSQVRLAVSGAAALPAEVLAGVQERFGTTIWEGYGLTEAGPAVTTNAAGTKALGGSIGRPLPGLEVRLADESGETADPEDPGEILVRGPNVFKGYWRNEEETEAAFFPEGWLRTGDVAVAEDDGYLYIVDRKKDLIIVSGFNVYPGEVEEALLRHPAVAEAAVVGVPDERTGEAVRALVVLHPEASATPEEIGDETGRHLARFKVPRTIGIVDSLPKHVTGKVLRRALREEPEREGESADQGRP